jgi:hypothetical protein
MIPIGKSKQTVVLPAKPGDIIYRPEALQFCWVIAKAEIYEDEIVFIDDSDNIFRPDDIGKTVFLSREEAEKALQEGVKRLKTSIKAKKLLICDNCGEGQECDNWAEAIDFMNEEEK